MYVKKSVAKYAVRQAIPYDCTVCRASRKDAELLFRAKCGHYFHKSCLAQFLKLSTIHLCPRAAVCRKFLTAADLESNTYLNSDSGIRDAPGYKIPTSFRVAWSHPDASSVPAFQGFFGRFIEFREHYADYLRMRQCVIRGIRCYKRSRLRREETLTRALRMMPRIRVSKMRLMQAHTLQRLCRVDDAHKERLLAVILGLKVLEKLVCDGWTRVFDDFTSGGLSLYRSSLGKGKPCELK